MTEPAIRRRLASLAEREYERIGAQHLRLFPLQHYLEWFSSPDTEGNYSRFPGELEPWFKEIASVGSERLLHAYHRLAVCELMSRSVVRLADGDEIAPAICEAQLAWYGGLVDRLEANPDMAFDYHHDFFHKDIHLCSMRMLTTRGPCHFELSHLSRRFLITGGMVQAARGLRALLIDLRGETKRLYSHHVDDRLIYPHFLEDGWIRCYQDIAAQMRMQPDIVGLFAASWFWDPKVKELTPKLGYLRDYPATGGAHFFELDSSENTIALALTDRRRRAAYEVGAYVPTSWLMVWPRSRLLRFVH